MLTLFSLPKPFRGHINTIQRNAIKSWTCLHPNIEIILFGDEDGTREAAREFGTRHEPEIRRYEDGAPLLDSIFNRAWETARRDILCYVNCDILLMSDFRRALEFIVSSCPRFLMIGKRWNLDVTAPIEFDPPDWEGSMLNRVRVEGNEQPSYWIDYFAFSCSLRFDVPPFAVGRYRYDQWLVWKFRSLRVPVVDASPVVRAVHQNHDYSHLPEVATSGGRLSEQCNHALRNSRLAGGGRHLYTIDDATHRLHPHGIEYHWGHSLMPWKRALVPVWRSTLWPLLRVSRPLRHRLGLRRGFVARALGKESRAG